MRLSRDGKIEIEVEGFAPSSEVVTAIHSDPVLVGRSTATGSGTLAISYSVPASVPDGNHTVVLSGEAPGGKSVTFALAVVVGEDTGSAPWLTLLIAGPIVLAVLTALFLPAVTRRRRAAPLA